MSSPIEWGMLGIRITFPLIDNRLAPLFHIEDADSARSRKGFISNPLVRKAIEEAHMVPGTRLGYALLYVEGNVARWVNFYPFERTKTEPLFKKKGIGRIIEIYVLQHIKEAFPGVTTIRHSGSRSGDRLRKLSQLNLGTEYSLEKGLRRLRLLAAIDAHAHHARIEKPLAAHRLLASRRARRHRPMH